MSATLPTDPQVELLIEEAIDVDAAPARVWALVADPRLMPRWSPQVWKVFARTPGPVHVGSRYLNVNRSGLLVWSTASQVIALEHERSLSLRIRDNRTVWAFQLHPMAGGRTRLIQRRECPDGVAQRALRLERLFMGGVPQFQQTLRQGMRITLARIKDAAEG